ncbi:SDR family NAD(P)-dependent oxidoreductase [Paenibacillus sp. GYB003]|uniref:SDR family NAD(P)-dependent oxidoreductase n=1 Tax=Paenibacillus sp. GYB003 TaxID=2994392 RepID=UPI002F96A8FC
MKQFIVTGASKGLGQALLRELMRPECRLIGMARSDAGELAKEAAGKGVALRWIRCDLGDAASLEAVMEQAFAEIDGEGLDTIGLINNAGVIEPIAPAAVASGEDLIRNVSVNLIAPVVLTAAFLRLTAGWKAKRLVLNVSSGAGSKPYSGWSAYCASKAGLDMFTRCVGAEQEAEANGARVLSAAPGVVDTAMQRDIRAASPELFPSRERFVELHSSGRLAGADETAAKLLRTLFDERHPSGSVLDVRDLY